MWTVLFSQRFDDWLSEQDEALQEKVLADLGKLKVYGPELPRPYADTIKGSRYKNMKELRVQYAGHPIRVTISAFMTSWSVSLRMSSMLI